MAELSLPERIVHAAELALEEAAATVHRGVKGVYSVDGYPTDLATAAAAATIEAMAEALAGEQCCADTDLLCCSKCGLINQEVANLHFLAGQIREVRPLEVT